MEHIFLLNPHAGKGSDHTRIRDMATRLAENHGVIVSVHETNSGAEATELVRSLAQTGQSYRIYACGGDGTLHHVVAGAAGHENVAVTCIPMGSGNDFLRNFGNDKERFFDPENLWDGDECTLDLIDCNGQTCLTIACFGVDARVADGVHRFTKWPLVAGRVAYLLSVAHTVLRPIGRHWTVVTDGVAQARTLSVVATCNGRYYGGGSCPVPQARMDDGVLDTILVGDLSLLSFAKLFPAYSAGHHEKIAKYIEVIRPEVLEIRSSKQDITICLDGEITHSDHVVVQRSAKTIRFFVPKGASPNATAKDYS